MNDFVWINLLTAQKLTTSTTFGIQMSLRKLKMTEELRLK